jgi:hypothetical protein
MSAIDFVVRGDAGVVERGALGGSGSNSLVVGAGQEISLNLQRNSVLSYTRNGQALEVTLVDGQVITLQGFFSPDGVAGNKLFLSASGQLAEVDLVAGEGNLLYGQYVDADSFGKWSPDDSLYFVDDGGLEIAGVDQGADAAMLGAPLLAGLGGLGGTAAIGAAAVGGALLLGGGSGGGGPAVAGDDESGGVSPDPVVAPVVGITSGTKGADHVVNGDDYADGVDVGGTGTPGATGTVTVGDVTRDITIGEDGTWAVTLTPDEIAGGEYEVPVSVTITTEGGSTSSSDVIVLDTITDVTLDTSAAGGDGTVNEVEHPEGVAVNGLAEANSTVAVTAAGVTQTVTADADGVWSATFSADDIPVGTYDLEVTAVATDAAGNTATASGAVQIDTEVSVAISEDQIEGDGIVNAVERADGVDLIGTSDPGASVDVTFEGVTRSTVTDADGNWSVSYGSDEVPTGDIESGAPVSVIATDPAGNVATTSGTVTFDTYVNALATTGGPVEGDDIVNRAEAADGITLTGIVEAGSSVTATFEGVTKAATVNDDGTWSVSYAAGEVPSGTYNATVRIDATDAAGNTASINETFLVDTDVPDAADVTGFIEVQNDTAGAIIRASSDVLDGESDVSIHQVGEGAADGAIEIAASSSPVGENVYYGFDDNYVVPNGSHLIVEKADAAGNTNSTLMVLDVNGDDDVDVTAGALSDFNIGAIDLEHAENSVVDLSSADLEAMSANDNILVIHGRDTDTVNLEGAATQTGTQTINGKDYDVYSVGADGGQLIINSEIAFNQDVV